MISSTVDPPRKEDTFFIAWINARETASCVHIIHWVGDGNRSIQCLCGAWVGNNNIHLDPQRWPKGFCKKCIEVTPFFMIKYLGLENIADHVAKSGT